MVTDPKSFHEQLIETIRPTMRWAGEDPIKWQKDAREKLKMLLMMPEKNCESDLCIEWREELPLYTETRFTFQTEKGFYTAAHLLMPKNTQKPRPVICLQGHSTGMHISIGRAKYPGDEKTIAGGRDFAIQAVKRGYAAIALEQRAFGELGGDETGPKCMLPAMQALLMGRTLLGERVFDTMRLVDVLFESFSDALDLTKICLTGNSGGGTVTVYTAALDERISVSAPSCAYSTFLHSIGNQLHCTCNYVPGIHKYFDMAELSMMVSPRPQIVMSGKTDVIFPHDKAHDQVALAKEMYRAMGAEDNILHLVGPEGHRYYPDLAWPNIDRFMGNVL